MTAATPAPELLALMQPGYAAGVVPFADLLRRPEWMTQRACANELTARFFASPSSKQAVRAIDACRRCAVRRTCLAFALEHDERGIWGGTTDRERDRLLAGRSWAELDEDVQEQLLDAGVAVPSVASRELTGHDVGRLESPTGRSGVSGRTTRPAKPATPCENDGCSEPATGRFCSQRCRSADGARRRRERRVAKAGERSAVSAEMAAVEAKLDEVFKRRPSPREAG